jgi:1-acyl-sn-glycerol-3-phosphate acyltransferase
MLGMTLVGVATSPIIVVALVARDLAKRRFRLPTVRAALFVLQYAINDSIEIALAPMYWAVAGFGTRLHDPASIRRHERLQLWSLDVLARRAERLLGLRFEMDDVALAALGPGPVIVVCRHVSIIDASLPALVYQRIGYRTIGVIMAELLADPGFDLIYGRTGSVFIGRDDGVEAREAVAALGRAVDARTAVVIFPEGRLFRLDRLAKTSARIATENAQRAHRLASLTRVLPPRPGGLLALLDAIPAADVVVIAHAGLDRFPTFAMLARAAPLSAPVRVTAWRVPACDIPTSVQDRIRWLDEQWLRVDHWVGVNS